MEPPTLEGSEVRLVPLDLDVLDGMKALGTDPNVLRFTYISAPFTRENARAWIQRYIDGWADGTRAGFSIQSMEGTFFGMAAVIEFSRETRQGEIGYILAPEARGRGVATAALRLLGDWAIGELGLARVELRIAADNSASIAVAERCGFAYEGTLRSLYFKDGLRADTAIYSRLPDDG
ncbi:MAG TPA: GNAT family N-acetyltransferase [Actinomycetota bacterium]|nr:GNAT family N-acetyltransferase [Actinomycetota bacterium]